MAITRRQATRPQARFPNPAGRGRRPDQPARQMRQQPRRDQQANSRHATHARHASPSPATTAQHPAACGKAASSHTAPGTPTASGEAPTSPLPCPGGIPAPQARHHSTQMPQASTIQNQARACSRRPGAEHIGRIRRDKARHPVRQLHLQMRHPVHVPVRVGPNPVPAQRMCQRRDHDLARQQGTETS